MYWFDVRICIAKQTTKCIFHLYLRIVVQWFESDDCTTISQIICGATMLSYSQSFTQKVFISFASRGHFSLIKFIRAWKSSHSLYVFALCCEIYVALQKPDFKIDLLTPRSTAVEEIYRLGAFERGVVQSAICKNVRCTPPTSSAS